MLIKEYRIPLPLTVEEYRIAQLFMIAVSFFYCFPNPKVICNLIPTEKKS